jgi:hypothetical protein
MKYHRYYYALISGCLGASASCFAKLAFGTTSTTMRPSLQQQQQQQHIPTNEDNNDSSVATIVDAVSFYHTINICHYLVGSKALPVATTLSSSSSKTDPKYDHRRIWNDPQVLCSWTIFVLYRCICVVGMIVCNIYMIGTFLKGMDDSGTIAGTALSTSSNFILSAVYGYFIWDERHTMHWWIGLTMVCLGMTILTQCSSTTRDQQEIPAASDHVKTD